MTDDAEADDETLAERVAARGDLTAFTEIIHRYRGRLIALARRMLDTPGGGIPGSADEAEDVAQETLVAAYQKRTTYRRGERFRPWLYRIAVNRCLDRLRAQSRHRTLPGLDTIAEPVEPGPNPMQALLVEEREARLRQAVAALPPKHRAVFLLRHLDDLSYDEIAEATGLPLGTVKTHLFRARAELRASLKGYLEL